MGLFDSFKKRTQPALTASQPVLLPAQISHRIAVLIDADNLSSKFADEIFAEISNLGRITISRAYGDWSTGNLEGWRAMSKKYSIEQIQQSRLAGKNSSDIALVIDAMDLLWEKKFDIFVIASSDSDFMRLVLRLKKDGVFVFGIGEEKSLGAFAGACDKFHFLNHPQNPAKIPEKKAEIQQEKPKIPQESKAKISQEKKAKNPQEKSKKKPQIPAETLDQIWDLIGTLASSYPPDGWIPNTVFLSAAKQAIPNFSYKNYGFGSLKTFFRSLRPELELSDDNKKIRPKIAVENFDQIWDTIVELSLQSGDSEGWIANPAFLRHMAEKNPKFSYKNYGFRSAKEFFMSLQPAIEMNKTYQKIRLSENYREILKS